MLMMRSIGMERRMRMLKCDGYMMFEGRATVTPRNDKPPYALVGTWLYRPDIDAWCIGYCEEYPWGTTFPREMVSDFVERIGAYA